MPFTHDIPSAARHYAVGFSAHTGAADVVASTFREESSNTSTTTGNRSVTIYGESESSYDPQSKTYYTKNFNVVWSAPSLDFSRTESTISVFSKTLEEGKSGLTSTFSTSYPGGNIYTGGTTTQGEFAVENIYGRTYATRTHSSTGFNTQASYSQTSSGSSSTLSSSDRVGDDSIRGTRSTFRYSQSADTRTSTTRIGTDADTQETIIYGSGESSYTSSSTFEVRVLPQTVRQLTLLTSVTSQNFKSISTSTQSTSASYSILSPDLLSTQSSSYSLRTSVASISYYSDEATVETYEYETVTYGHFTDSTYRVYTVTGGAFFVTGGDVLPNSVMKNVDSTTEVTDLRFFPTAFNSYIIRYNEGIQNTLTSTRFGATVESTITTILSTSSEDTLLATRSATTNSTLDFGRSSGSFKEFYTTTFPVYFQTLDTITRISRQTTTDGTAQVSSLLGSNYTSKQESITIPVYGDGAFSTFERSTLVYSYITNQTITYNLAPTTTREGLTRRRSSGSSVIPDRSDIYSSGGGADSVRFLKTTVATIDKGFQGGIQYQTSSDISGAVRGYREMTIADVLPSTTTSSSSFVTVTSGKTQSFTGSANFPLDLSMRLNRYISFFPYDGYGNIYTDLDGMPYHLSVEDSPASIVGFTSTGAYSTEKEDSKGTRAFSNRYYGLVKVGLGAQFTNGTGVRIFSTAGTNSPFITRDGIMGGGVFTDDPGFYFYEGLTPPASFYAFGKDSSSFISQDSTDIPNYFLRSSIELPVNHVVFNPNTSFLSAALFGSHQTYDLAQNKI